MERREVLRNITFGARVAEEEMSRLARYFVETDQWERIFRGEIDVIKGYKGAGKSAIYSLLIDKKSELFDRGILLVAGERPQGTPIFKELVTDPPTSEAEFVNLWKLYITAIIIETARDYGISNSEINRVKATLVEQGILEAEFDLSRLLKKTLAYVRTWTHPKSLETTFLVDPSSLLTLPSVKISPGEPDEGERARGFVSIDRLIALAAQGLTAARFDIWVLLDRLDVAFAETHELERNALRALFRVYLDIANFSNIKLKIFIRSDIWGDIVDHGFREASHITKELTIEWSRRHY
jgi:hypothetical protein